MSHSGGETSVEWLITYYESFKTLCYFSEIIDEKRVLEKLCERKLVKNCVNFLKKNYGAHYRRFDPETGWAQWAYGKEYPWTGVLHGPSGFTRTRTETGKSFKENFRFLKKQDF